VAVGEANPTFHLSKSTLFLKEGTMRRERALKIVLVVVGLLFTAGVYPLVGSLLHPADSDTGDTMMLSLYVASAFSCSSRCGIHRRIGA
jgi:hypothetical protein